MNICIVGLGTIGGSYAKAIKKYTDHTVFGIENDKSVAHKALGSKAVDEIVSPERLSDCELVILCIYPHAAIAFTEKYGGFIKDTAIVTDACGIKSEICPKMTELSHRFGFTFVGSHPMAGTEKNGFDVSSADLFKGASFLVVSCDAPKRKVDALCSFALSIGFSGIKLTSATEHDRMIAFTSQLPHVLACSYVMSPCCMNHNGFSAGSYRDVSRVANINAKLWSELFLENKEPLCAELDILIENITLIKNAVESENSEHLCELLHRGRQIKEALGE